MSRSACLISVAVACALFIVAAGRAAAADAPDVAPGAHTDLQRLIDAGLYRTAAETLRTQLGRATESGTPGGNRHTLLLLLVEVYYRSGQYDDAMAATEQAMAELAELTIRHPQHGFKAERLETALWQAQIELARRKSGAARRPPADPFQGNEIKPEGLTLRQQAELLQLQVLQAELSSDARPAQQVPAAPSPDSQPWRDIRRRAEALLRDMPETPEAIAARVSAVRSLARCLDAQQQPDLAVAALRDLLGRPSCGTAELKAVWTDIARIHHRAKHYRPEALAWQKVLHTEADELRLVSGHETLAILDRLNAQAAVRLDLAAALYRAGDAGGADKQQDSAAQLYQQVLDRTAQTGADSVEQAEWGSRKAVAQQGLLQLSRTQLERPDPLPGMPKRDFMTDARDLQHWVLQNRLPSDPVVYQVEATILQALVLRAEANRVSGNWDDARRDLDSATQFYRQANMHDENSRLWLQVYQGRLAAARGEFDPAKKAFTDVVQRAKKLGAAGSQSASLASLSLALLYKGYGQLDKAEEQCRAALECHRPSTGDDDPQLLRCHLALAGILILDKKPGEAEGEIKRTRQLADHLPPDANERRELCHLEAMLDLMRYKSDQNETLAETARQKWTELYRKQALSRRQTDQARTCYYLSRLALFRWQRQVDELRRYDKAYNGYEAKCNKYHADLASFQAKKAQYSNDKQALERQDTQARQPLVAPLEREWGELERLYKKLQAGKKQLDKDHNALKPQYVVAKAAHEELASKLLAEAKANALEAISILDSCQLYPSLHYVVLCHYAEVLRAQAISDPGLKQEVPKCLEQAVALLEQPRVSFAEGDLVRAEFLSQYTAAFDQLVAWYVENHDPAEALVCAERCRSRMFLDRLRREGYDLTRTLLQKDPDLLLEATKLARHSAELGKKLRAIENRPADDALHKELQEVCQENTKLQQQILQESPLGDAGFGKLLSRSEVRDTVTNRISKGPCTLYYYVGAADCYLFVLGVPPGVLVTRLSAGGGVGEDLGDHVSVQTIAKWAQTYTALLTQPGAFLQACRDPARREACRQIAHNLLPPEALDPLLKALRDRGGPLLISPAADLQQVPFEALLLQGSDQPQFLIDRLPPTGTVYIPSLMIAEALKANASRRWAQGVLSVGGPLLSGFDAPKLAHLPDLKAACEESNAVAKRFQSQGVPVHQLLGGQATEKRFRQAIADVRPNCLHVATHTAHHNDATALLFCPGLQSAEAGDDGLLEIREIYKLPLQQCDLAVLSACRTNDGPPIPRDTPVSLAQAFLVAGTRRVVASQWDVSDAAAYQFVNSFFENLTPPGPSDRPCGYAAAAQAARQRLRQSKDQPWSDPYYWSSFVLIGAAD